jgi:hypothetical protein
MFIKGHPKITDSINPVYWLPEEMYYSGFGDAPTSLYEQHCNAL